MGTTVEVWEPLKWNADLYLTYLNQIIAYVKNNNHPKSEGLDRNYHHDNKEVGPCVHCLSSKRKRAKYFYENARFDDESCAELLDAVDVRGKMRTGDQRDKDFVDGVGSVCSWRPTRNNVGSGKKDVADEVPERYVEVAGINGYSW